MRLVSILFILIYIAHVHLDDRPDVNWNTEEGTTLPILGIHFQDEIFSIPLKEAPFCRLVITNNCDCFMLRKGYNGSDWIMGSFAYCGGTVRGTFMNLTDYFEIEPLGNSSSREYNVTKFPPEENRTVELIDPIRGDPVDSTNTSLYSQPFAASWIEDYQTAFIPCLFVIDQAIINSESLKLIDYSIQDIVNVANQVFFEFNIVVVNKGWKPFGTQDPAKSTEEIVDQFLRGGYKDYINDINDQIMVILLFPEKYFAASGTYIGWATGNGICRPSTGLYVYHFPRNRGFYKMHRAEVFAHEVGHTLGMSHDDQNECKKIPIPKRTKWIMGAGLLGESQELGWSPCSKDLIKRRRKRYFCLKGKPKPLKPSCGNGILEKGEQCECVSEACKKCCDDKCQLTKGSSCASGPCCDMKTCKPRLDEDKYTCRKVRDVCDLPEMCSGKTHKCPANYVVANGYGCGKSYSQGGYCYNGLCGSRQDVCSWAYTGGSIGEEDCYVKNEDNGSSIAGCGPIFGDPNFRKEDQFGCKKENIHCGKLFCVNMRNDSLLTHDYNITKDQERIDHYFFLRCVLFSLGESTRFLREDPTFVQNGSACGVNDEKMCVRQACVPLPSGCPGNCPGKRKKHPETGESFPVLILPDPEDELPHDEEGNGTGESYLLLILTLICGSIILASLIFCKILSKKGSAKHSHRTTSDRGKVSVTPES